MQRYDGSNNIKRLRLPIRVYELVFPVSCSDKFPLRLPIRVYEPVDPAVQRIMDIELRLPIRVYELKNGLFTWRQLKVTTPYKGL